MRVPQRTLTASMARAYQWLTVLAALAMFVLAFWVFAPFLFGFIGTLPLIGGALAVRALLRRRSVWGYVVWLTMMAAMAAPFLYLGIPHHDVVVVQPSPPGSPERVAIPHDAEPAWIAIGAFHALLGLLALLELGRLAVAQHQQRATASGQDARS